MSNIVLIKALAVAVRDHFQDRNELTDAEVAMIAASAYEASMAAFERIRTTRTAMGALASGAGKYHVGERRLGSDPWRQITKRARTFEEARQMAIMAPSGFQRNIADPTLIERMAERGEWVRQ